jgi:hypothetical protein
MLVHVYGLHTSVKHVWAVQIIKIQKGMQVTTSMNTTWYTLRWYPLHPKNLFRRGVLEKVITMRFACFMPPIVLLLLHK